MTTWIRAWVDGKKAQLFWNIYRDATGKALESLEEDLRMIVEPKTLYDKGWNDAMKTMVRTIQAYKRSGFGG